MTNLTKVDEKRVTDFIVWSRIRAPKWLKDSGKTPPYSSATISYAAWQLLRGPEVRGNKLHKYDEDFDAAAAEHYMYIRYVAGSSGDPYCYVAPAGYALKKVFAQLTGNLQRDQTQDGHPVLPANPYVVAWGQRGVTDGLADYKSATEGADYKFGAAVETLATFSYSADSARKMGEYAVDPLTFMSGSDTAK